ncbi:unnamed protein product [Penicillium olsonii]|nr:unnamed protein product [Penicillium olsonii]
MASTPPPPSPSALRVPRAPRHGPKLDDYEPYPTRYSTRLASQRIARAAHTTPPPSLSNPSAKSGAPKRTLSPTSPETVKPSSKKAAQSHASSSSRISSSNSAPSNPRTSSHQPSRSSAERALPTPVKTPSRKKDIPSGAATPRTLFPPSATSKRRKMDTHKQADEVRPISKKFQVYSDEVQEDKPATAPGGIAIHTDSRDRIPVPDEVLKLFAKKPETSGTGRATRSTPARREITPDGAWYLCRGNPVFKRFDDMEESDDDESDLGLFANRPDLLEKNPDCLKDIKSLKRSEIKPRMLFARSDPPAYPPHGNPNVINTNTNTNTAPPHDAEEDVTDVEENEADPFDVNPESDDCVPGVTPQGSLYNGTPFTCDLLDETPVGNGTLLRWLRSSRQKHDRDQETPAERLKRHRETRGSPNPRTRTRARTRMAHRAEAEVEGLDVGIPAESSTDA